MHRLTIVSTLTALALSATPALGQGIGAHAGVVFSTVAGDSVSDAEYSTGFAIGANVTLPIAPGFAIRPELNYMQMGADVSLGAGVSGSVGLDYIEIPVLLVLSLPNPVGPRPYAFAGPAVAFEAACNLEATSGGTTLSASCDDADFIERKSMVWALQAGAGIGFGLGPGMASLDVRYDLGLTSIDDSPDPVDVKNRAIALMLGFSIGM